MRKTGMIRHVRWSLRLFLVAVSVTSVPSRASADEWLSLRGQSPDDAVEGRPASFRQYEPQNEPLPDQPLTISETLPEGLSMPEEPAAAALPPPIVPGGTNLVLSWTSGSGDDLGMTDIDLRQTLIFTRLPGFMVSPGTSVHFLTGPETTDLPETLYDHWIEFRYLKKFNDRWAMDLAITPSLYTDYENVGSDAFRMTGRVLALWTCSPQFQAAFGFIYLDREDILALPAVGAIWTPNDDYKVELLFPRPRVMKKLAASGDKTRWIYVGGEFGGGSWAIDRADGTADVFTYSALRFLVGYEVKQPRGFSPRVEAGYIFNRQVEYKSEIGDYDPNSAFMVRFGGAF